jgi:hypothetical protein
MAIPLTVLAWGVRALLRGRRRREIDLVFPQDPVSSDWLAQARSRDDSHW